MADTGTLDLSALPPAQRVALELAVLEGLQVPAIAHRMQFSAGTVVVLLGDGLRSLRSTDARSLGMLLETWRESQRVWERLPARHPSRVERAVTVAHAFVAYQCATGSLPKGHAVFVTDLARRYIAVTANAASLLGRRTLVGLTVDDVTPEAGRAKVPELWAKLLTEGSMAGEYVFDRPGQLPILLSFRVDTDRPLPGLQVSYVAPASLATASSIIGLPMTLESGPIAQRDLGVVRPRMSPAATV